MRSTGPLPLPDAPGLLGVVDLPPTTVDVPSWVATEPEAPRVNVAATRCDRTSFRGGGVRAATTRTFVPRVEQGRDPAPDAFGLTETAGVAGGKAKSFVASIRSKLAGCHDKDIGTDVTQVTQRSEDTSDLTVWRLDVDVSKKKTVRFLMAVLRDHGLEPGSLTVAVLSVEC